IMNIFEKQKQEKNTKIETLEEMKATIEELKKLENQMQETAKNLSIKYSTLTSHLDALDIAKISKTISTNEDKIVKQIAELEIAVASFKIKINNEAQKNINSYTRASLYFMYIPFLVFIGSLGLIAFIYFSSIRHLENKAEELAKQNNLLKDRINGVYWILAEDQKFWYDKESQKFFIKQNSWIKDYKKNLQNSDKKKL
ncbi:MAG: hypothetical protein ACRCW5_09575, partial [Cetobacterium sp.]|uniref:hypothetical protein n=1 Tax=Cetobacterium sp. TaxID=2071632 RepID=UPI003F2ED25E